LGTPHTDEFLTALCDRLHETPMQRKLRRIAPLPVGVVFIERPGMTDEDIRGHFRRMRELGFTCLKGIHLCPGSDLAKVMHTALDEGIIPWWYGEGGWEPITDELLERLGIPGDTPIDEIRRDDRMRAYQEAVLRARIDSWVHAQQTRRTRPPDRQGDERFSFDHVLHPTAVGDFVEWLHETYGSLEAVYEAWNVHHAMIRGPSEPWVSWRELAAELPELIGGREYRRIRDVLRFKADLYLERVRRRRQAAADADPAEPMRAGGEMGLFLPFAARATDMEGIAEEMAEGGSFYPSIHLAWHFEEVNFEVVRPVYMQASLVQDWFKGGWSAAWESTGGPQQFSGGKAPFWPPAADKTPGFTVDAGVMTQLMLSYLAAGFRGFGFWCWSPRTAGWEAGEFAIVDRNLQPTDRAVRMGCIGQAAQRCRDELWQAHKEPVVGIFTDFDSEAIWAAMAVHGRDHFRSYPVRARIGASRALINHNVPWEYVTGSDLRNGLAGRYKVIYLPAVIAIAHDLLEILADYVAAGGRLVVDAPSCWYDDFGRLLPTGPGTAFERVFGCTIRDFQYSSNVPRALHGRALDGFVLDLGLTTGKALAAYEDGRPAVTENACGSGAGVVIGCEASLTCAQPGDKQAEHRLVTWALGPHQSPYACGEAIVYRLAAPAADHYFLLNDGPATKARLDAKAFRYAAAEDVVSQEKLPLGEPVELPAFSGRWLRLTKPT
jgi:beta-galactosidase